jgi:hypothetical protein
MTPTQHIVHSFRAFTTGSASKPRFDKDAFTSNCFDGSPLREITVTIEEENHLMLKKMSAVAISGLFAVLAYSGPARATLFGLTGTFLVQASGTAYFAPPFVNGVAQNGVTEVLHFTMAGTATFLNGSNTAANLTLNLGGEDDYSTQGEYNPLICYLTQPGDLFYTAGSGSTPATLTVTYNAGDTCGGPNGVSNTGLGNGGISEANKWIPFNFYPNSPLPATGGAIVSNYTYLTSGGSSTSPASYPHGWIDSGSTFGGGTGSHVAYGFSVTGQLTPLVAFP